MNADVFHWDSPLQVVEIDTLRSPAGAVMVGNLNAAIRAVAPHLILGLSVLQQCSG